MTAEDPNAATTSVTPRDPIEWAAHYWELHQIDGDERRFLVLGSLLRFHRLVTEVVDRELREHGLNLTDYLMLMTLELSDAGTRLISGLARSLLVHPTTATLATDRLEGRGLLRRSPHPTDRRAICVTITEDGRQLVKGATVALDAIGFGLSTGQGEELAIFGELLDKLREEAEQTRAEVGSRR